MSLGFMAGAIPASVLCGFLIAKVAYKHLFVASFALPIAAYWMLSRNIHGGIANLSGEFPDGTSETILNGGFPPGLSVELVHQIKGVFAGAFQHMFAIGIAFAVAAFVLTLFLRKEVLTQRTEAAESTRAA